MRDAPTLIGNLFKDRPDNTTLSLILVLSNKLSLNVTSLVKFKDIKIRLVKRIINLS